MRIYSLILKMLLFSFLLLSLHRNACAWPTAAQWIPIYKNSSLLQDPNGDANGPRNVVSDQTHAAAYVFNDGSYIYFRLRLDKDPTGSGGQGLLQAYGWGVEIDTNRNAGDYEWILMLDGISKDESIQLSQNTIQSTLGDPSDKAEILNSSIPLLGNYQVVMADTSFNGDADYFIDWRFPYAAFKQATGLSDGSPIRFFFGSSPSTNNLTSNGGDLVGGSDLYSGYSDTITPLGTLPTTGTVKFAADLAGQGDVIQIYAGNMLYLRVDDGDRNYDNATLQSVTVTLQALSGDSAVLTLTETSPNSGIFTGAIATQSGNPATGDGILQVTPGTTVIVEYIDAIDSSYNVNQIRSDSVHVVSLLPAITLVKSVDKEFAPPGAELIYTVYYHNVGVGAAMNLIITDMIPTFTTYVDGSMKIGSAASSYSSAAALTDAMDGDAGQISGSNIIFTINTVVGDDGAVNAGSDEGKVYFKVKIN